MHNQDEGGAAPLGPRPVGSVVTSELKGDWVTISLKAIHMDENVGGRNWDLSKAREANGVD